MISYYRSKHPGLWIYLTLLTATVVTFLFLGATSKTIGLFSVLWGSFMVMRTLSLYEISEHFSPLSQANPASKNSNKDRSFLAHDLKRRKEIKNHMNRGIYAFYALTPRTLFWFILALVYCVSYGFLSTNLSSTHDIVEYICIAFMIGGAFWTGQTYAYSHFASKLIFITTSILFALSLYFSADLNTPTQLNLDHITLFILMIYSIACLIYAFRYGIQKGIYIIFGIAVLGTVLLYTNFHINTDNHVIWISGISLFSIFWIRAHRQSKKQYILYQCE